MQEIIWRWPADCRRYRMEETMQIVKNEFLAEALGRLKKEAGQVSGQKEKAMAGAVREALEDFCRQEPEFAQAIVQGGSFKDCMAAVAKGVGGSISDAEAYARAARFYFPGSRVRVIMELDLVGDARGDAERGGAHCAPLQKEEAEQKKVAVQLVDLGDFF